MSDGPVLLITNDDGVHAAGIRALAGVMADLGEVVVVAPTHEQSGKSHAITFDRPLRHIEHEPEVHSIDGTPADCVYLALFEPRFLGGRRPDLVISGINHGFNLGTSVFYSGTVAGAREGAMRGVPALALSTAPDADMGEVARASRGLVERLLESTHPAGQAVLLNVNIPWPVPETMRVTCVGRQIYEEDVIPRRDPGGREYFWIGGVLTGSGEVEGSDCEAVEQGFSSITPLELEPTNAEHLAMAAYVGGPTGPDAEESP